MKVSKDGTVTLRGGRCFWIGRDRIRLTLFLPKKFHGKRIGLKVVTLDKVTPATLTPPDSP